MSEVLFTLEPLPKDYPGIEFGCGAKCKEVQFIAYYYDNWLRAICFGGTAFAIQCKEEDVPKLMNPLMDMTEYEVIHYCNENNNWHVFNYDSNEVMSGKRRIFIMDCGFNITQIVE